jgi:hypothetical protein
MQLEETAVGGPHLVTNLFVLIIERANLSKRINSLLRVGPAKFVKTNKFVTTCVDLLKICQNE